MKAPLTEGTLARDHVVAERHPDASVLLAPGTSAAAIRGRLRTTPLTAEDFERHVGDLPADGEG